MTPFDPKAFREATKAFVGNCSVITVGAGDQASGLVVTSVVAPTTDPARLMFAINPRSSSYPLIKETGRFGWSSLGAGDQAVAERFSGFGGVSGPARHDGADWDLTDNGTRLLADAPAAFDCEVEEIIDRMDHAIIVARVVGGRTTPGKGGLVYWNGAFRALKDGA